MNAIEKSAIWHGKLFSNEWVIPRGGVANVTDPSSGEVLGLEGYAKI